jgi:hypothetical protein
MRVFGIILGVILLLPGACSLVVMSQVDFRKGEPSFFAPFWIVGFLISAGGVAMIVKSVRGPRAPPREPPD